MKRENIAIRYGDSEYGWAEPLGNKLVRILNQPVLAYDEIWKGDIVRIRKDSTGKEVYPVIEDVVYSRCPCKTEVQYQDEDDLYLLRMVLTVLRGEMIVLDEPSDDESGIVIVGHTERIDPVVIALGLGIEQPFFEDGKEAECGTVDQAGAGPKALETGSELTSNAVAGQKESVLQKKMERFFSGK